MTNILVADDHPLIVEGFYKIFADNEKIKICGRAKDGEDVIEKYKELRPGLVVMDIRLPVINGFNASRIILEEIDPGARILFYSLITNRAEIFKAYKIGGKGFIHKDRESGKLLEAVATIMNGSIYFDETFTQADYKEYEINYADSSFRKSRLSSREYEVLEMLIENYSNKEIGQKLFISERTVEEHRRRIKKKLQITGNTDLIKKALEIFGKI